MAGNPALWSDIARDLEAGLAQLRKAAALHDLARAEPTPSLTVEALHLAIGKCLDAAYSVLESALERLVVEIDGHRPTGAAFHAELIRRAAHPVEGLRPPILPAALARDLDDLRRFRHAYRRVYEGFDWDRARPNLHLALRSFGPVAQAIEGFCRDFGVTPPDLPRRFGPPAT